MPDAKPDYTTSKIVRRVAETRSYEETFPIKLLENHRLREKREKERNDERWGVGGGSGGSFRRTFLVSHHFSRKYFLTFPMPNLSHFFFIYIDRERERKFFFSYIFF